MPSEMNPAAIDLLLAKVLPLSAMLHILTASDKLIGDISSSPSPLTASLTAGLTLLGAGLLLALFAAPLTSGFAGDVAAVDILLLGLLLAPLCVPLLGCADLSSSNPAGQPVHTCQPCRRCLPCGEAGKPLLC